MNLNISENHPKIVKLKEELREMAQEQGVKAAYKSEDLYSKSENFDVDEFLEIIREIRQSDGIENG